MAGKNLFEMEKITMGKWLKVGLFILMLLVLSACGGKDTAQEDKESAADREDNDLKEVSIMLDWYPNAVHSYLYVAQEKGYFAEEGVKVDIQFPANPTDPLTLAAANKITLGLYYQPDVIMARANENLPVKTVASIVRSPLNHLLVPEDSAVQSPKDLEGKKVGYPGIPLNEAILETMVKHDGGDFSKVDMIDVGFELNSALVTGNTDAVIGAYINHEVPVLKHNGFNTRYFNPVDYGVPSYNEIVLVTSDDTWEKDQEAIQAFWKAAKKGYEFMKENPDEALAILLKNQDKANFPLVEEVEKESLAVLLPRMEAEGAEFGSQDEKTFNEVTNWLKEFDLIKKVPKASDMMVNMEE
ncbi:putative hydroxymethylpyrimidine transport system substrate-binding protein [Bacillus benzoevorans]|uniref:Putative hydroxymethylpyrimidine transport system substrate-binding protein n=2 Tax=Bacillus benzoevorans TaxID=1456 RepID=A0A7X0HT39_9BACI|nr:putative hydroxymethylpyrimidine transport system substrate-binding protein [Bacillus benzoevorans]